MEAIWICGSPNCRPATTAANSSSIGAISGEWKACETLSRRVLVKPAAISSTTCSSPESTTADGPFTAATETRSSSPASSGSTSCSEACTATMAPPSGSASISRARAATRRQASSSEKIPATWAAAISPTE
ncbi:hypothetical protein Kisp01_22380 [Kineosporia sp. NBRC 101677]|nr:hypothetical protein Kisp01_22380 [Kineosporia sp. NBRC 101677]